MGDETEEKTLISVGDFRKVLDLSFKNFREIRRLFPIIAAILFIITPLFPVWGIDIHAVQYPQKVLNLDLYVYPRIEGDVVEVHRLNKYIGFYYPDPVFLSPNFEVQEAAIDVPEWSIGPIAFILPALAGLFVAVAPTERKLILGLKAQVIGTLLVFFGMLADVQYRLYQAGHTLDPDAPVLGVDEFTPPLIGRYEVANITSYSHLEFGSLLAIIAIVLLFIAFYYRERDEKVSKLPYLIKKRVSNVL